MPIEVREMVIKATVVPDAAASSGSSDAGSSSGGNNEEMVQLCVEKVLEILKEKDER